MHMHRATGGSFSRVGCISCEINVIALLGYDAFYHRRCSAEELRPARRVRPGSTRSKPWIAWLPPMLLNEIRECTRKSWNFAALAVSGWIFAQVRRFIFNPAARQPVSSRLMIVSERSYFIGGSIERPRIGRQSIYSAAPGSELIFP